jgi:protein ImuB
MDAELRASLVALGVRTVGAFAALELAEVERRWGPEGIAAWRLAHGEDGRRPVLTRAEAERCVSAELATPAASMEPVLFLVRAALDRLVRTLIADGRAAAAVAITLTLDDGRGSLPSGGVPHTITREVRPARALARVAPLFERCRSLLDRWSLPSPVCGVAVTITATAPLAGEQGSLLDTGWRDPAAAEAALERLRAELGPNVVVRPVAHDSHRPERRGAWVDFSEVATGDSDAASNVVVTASAAGGAIVESGGGPCDDYAALRLLESPEVVAVECRADGDEGAPAAMEWRGRRVAFARAEGTERLSGEWWKEGFRRDYWRCAGDGATEFLLYRAEDGRWFLHGWYD